MVHFHREKVPILVLLPKEKVPVPTWYFFPLVHFPMHRHYCYYCHTISSTTIHNDYCQLSTGTLEWCIGKRTSGKKYQVGAGTFSLGKSTRIGTFSR